MNQQMKCSHHKLDLHYFCETCKDLVCDDCLTLGPHQTVNHAIKDFNQAYKVRNEYIKSKIEQPLLQKKNILLDQLSKIDSRIHQIQDLKTIIEKDACMEFEGGILKRLNDQKGTLVAVLQKDISFLQVSLNDIDDYIHTFEHLSQKENVLPLLFMSKSLSQQLMRLLAIIIKETITSHPADLPRELVELRTKLNNSHLLDDQIEFKKQATWKCRQDKLEHLKQMSNDFHDKMESEVLHWVYLLKKVITEFDSLCLICTFCGCFMSHDIVNEECKLNNKPYQEVHLEFKGFCSKEPKMKHFGNSQHFFADPKPSQLRKNIYPNYGEHYEQKKAAKEIYLKIFRQLWFSIIDLKARRYLKQLDLKAIFEKYDPDKKGFLSIIKFKYILNIDLLIPESEVDSLTNYFKDDKEDKIYYEYFLNVDWYIEELNRLENQLKEDQEKYGRLYKQRSKSQPKYGPVIESQPRKVKPKVQDEQKFIYSSFTRFTQPLTEAPKPIEPQFIQPRFGFVERQQVNQEKSLPKEEQKASSFNTKKSSSVGTRRVQFESSVAESRFQESLPAGNHFAKFYE